MALPKEPAELEARLLTTISALRRIAGGLEVAADFTPGDLYSRACRNVALLAAQHADQVADQVSS